MTDLPGDHPLPHPELHTQTPLMFTMKVGDVLYRHHQIINDPIHFGWLGTIGSTIRIVLQAGLSEFSMQAKILTAVHRVMWLHHRRPGGLGSLSRRTVDR
jgi:hypothetical protein